MPGSALGFVAGTCLMLLLPQLPSAGARAGLAVAALVVGWRAGSFVPIALVAGVILCRAEAGSRMADQLEPDLEGRILAIEGRVASVPQTLAQGDRKSVV